MNALAFWWWIVQILEEANHDHFALIESQEFSEIEWMCINVSCLNKSSSQFFHLWIKESRNWKKKEKRNMCEKLLKRWAFRKEEAELKQLKTGLSSASFSTGKNASHLV